MVLAVVQRFFSGLAGPGDYLQQVPLQVQSTVNNSSEEPLRNGEKNTPATMHRCQCFIVRGDIAVHPHLSRSPVGRSAMPTMSTVNG